MFGIVVAFQDYSIAHGILGSKWIGFKNFKDFFSGVYFTRTLLNTLVISVYDLVVGFPAPLIFALLMNEIRQVRFKKIVQTTTYLPHFISVVVICGMIVDFFGTNGIVTKVLTWFGMPKMNYVGSAESFQTIYVLTNVWQGIGWGSIIYLAALAGIDQDLYEAAQVDGASAFHKFFRITLPLLVPGLTISVIFSVINALRQYDFVKIMTPQTIETIAVNAVSRMTDYNMLGYSSAIVLVLFLFIGVVTAVQYLILKKMEVDY